MNVHLNAFVTASFAWFGNVLFSSQDPGTTYRVHCKGAWDHLSLNAEAVAHIAENTLHIDNLHTCW